RQRAAGLANAFIQEGKKDKAIKTIDKILEVTPQYNVPYDVTIHDFYYICPRINLYMPEVGYCGIPNTVTCNACLSVPPIVVDPPNRNIQWWRGKMNGLLAGACNIYAPSLWASSEIKKVYPLLDITVIPHEQNISVTGLKKSTSIRVAILGVLADVKGQKIIKEMIGLISTLGLPIEIVLIGHSLDLIPASSVFFQTGQYKDDDLDSLINKISPDLFLFPGVVPETYSFTLSKAMRTGLPIMASSLGAIPERLQKYSKVYLYAQGSTAVEILEMIKTSV
ncbi:MAG: hypothetical protein WCP89_03080, partial [archaeon]